MIITVEALKELYTSLGGELTDTYDSIANGIPVSDYNAIPDMIQALAQKTGGSGSSLPAVTSDDNGKLLTVVEGAWDKAEASSGDVVVIKGTRKAETGSSANTVEWDNGLKNSDIHALFGSKEVVIVVKHATRDKFDYFRPTSYDGTLNYKCNQIITSSNSIIESFVKIGDNDNTTVSISTNSITIPTT